MLKVKYSGSIELLKDILIIKSHIQKMPLDNLNIDLEMEWQQLQKRINKLEEGNPSND